MSQCIGNSVSKFLVQKVAAIPYRYFSSKISAITMSIYSLLQKSIGDKISAILDSLELGIYINELGIYKNRPIH